MLHDLPLGLAVGQLSFVTTTALAFYGVVVLASRGLAWDAALASRPTGVRSVVNGALVVDFVARRP